MSMLDSLRRERKKCLDGMREEAKKIREYNKQLKDLGRDREIVHFDISKETLENKMFEIMWKANESIMTWDDLSQRAETLEEMIKEQGGEIV